MTRKLVAAIALVIAFGGVAAPAVAAAGPYKNCAEARKNGDTNIPRGSDKYGSHLDRDGDGIACESW